MTFSNRFSHILLPHTCGVILAQDRCGLGVGVVRVGVAGVEVVKGRGKEGGVEVVKGQGRRGGSGQGSGQGRWGGSGQGSGQRRRGSRHEGQGDEIGASSVGASAQYIRHFSSNSHGRVAARVGSCALEIQVGGGRKISNFNTVCMSYAIGIQGNFWKFELHRGGQKLIIPILLSSHLNVVTAAGAFIIPTTLYFVLKATHAFDASSEKELSLSVGDYIVVRKNFQKDIVKAAEAFTAVGYKHIEAEDCCKYGSENINDEIISKAASIYGDARRHVEMEQEDFNRLIFPQILLVSHLNVVTAAGAFIIPTTLYFMLKATHAFDAASEKELSLSVGDYIVVRKVSSSGWSEGECRGRAGWFPSAYVDKRERLPTTNGFSEL